MPVHLRRCYLILIWIINRNMNRVKATNRSLLTMIDWWNYIWFLTFINWSTVIFLVEEGLSKALTEKNTRFIWDNSIHFKRIVGLLWTFSRSLNFFCVALSCLNVGYTSFYSKKFCAELFKSFSEVQGHLRLEWWGDCLKAQVPNFFKLKNFPAHPCKIVVFSDVVMKFYMKIFLNTADTNSISTNF